MYLYNCNICTHAYKRCVGFRLLRVRNFIVTREMNTVFKFRCVWGNVLWTAMQAVRSRVPVVGDVPLQASTSPNAGDEMLTCLCNIIILGCFYIIGMLCSPFGCVKVAVDFLVFTAL